MDQKNIFTHDRWLVLTNFKLSQLGGVPHQRAAAGTQSQQESQRLALKQPFIAQYLSMYVMGQF